MKITKASTRVVLQAALSVALIPSLQLSQPTAQSADQDAAQTEPMPVLTAHGFSSSMPVIRPSKNTRPVPMPSIKLPDSFRRDSSSEHLPPESRWRQIFDGSTRR